MKTDIEVDAHHEVGPLTDVYSHSAVMCVGHLRVCLDCGYTVEDIRLMLHEECDRADNGITQTWREFLRDNEFPE